MFRKNEISLVSKSNGKFTEIKEKKYHFDAKKEIVYIKAYCEIDGVGFFELIELNQLAKIKKITDKIEFNNMKGKYEYPVLVEFDDMYFSENLFSFVIETEFSLLRFTVIKITLEIFSISFHVKDYKLNKKIESHKDFKTIYRGDIRKLVKGNVKKNTNVKKDGKLKIFIDKLFKYFNYVIIG